MAAVVEEGGGLVDGVSGGKAIDGGVVGVRAVRNDGLFGALHHPEVVVGVFAVSGQVKTLVLLLFRDAEANGVFEDESDGERDDGGVEEGDNDGQDLYAEELSIATEYDSVSGCGVDKGL